MRYYNSFYIFLINSYIIYVYDKKIEGDVFVYDRLTRKDVEKMRKEVEERKLVVRKQALEDVKEARAQGDLSENFEYKAAKQFKNRNESRIRYLEKMIKTAKIIEMILMKVRSD